MPRGNHPDGKTQGTANRLPPAATSEYQTHARNDVRASIAHFAARLIAEGLTDYRAAKQKAARRHGVTDGYALPDNHEIELALREHLALFARETQPRFLATLRATAIRVMFRLEQFSPWLVGAVLNGTANEFSEIELEFIGVEAKAFEMYLLNAGIEFALCDAHEAKRASPTVGPLVMKYHLEFDEAIVTIALYDHHTARQSVHPRDSVKRDRARRAEAERRFLRESGGLRNSCGPGKRRPG